jgi:S1/P1 Nuclease
MRTVLTGLVLLVTLAATPLSYAWGPDGHHTVATIAAALIAGSKAEAQVKALLGDVSLVDAAVWADCAKGVNPGTLQYEGAGKYPACQVFETPAGEAQMIDFVKRNSNNCVIKPGAEICHKQYHYADVAIQHGTYRFGWVGTRDDDIVAAVAAMTHVLKGDPAPSPFNIRDKREALLLLAHYVGDLHQPLHVGAIYLDAAGAPVDPDVGAFDPATDTRGGNNIDVLTRAGKRRGELHAKWDAIAASMQSTHVNAAWLAQARAVASATGTDIGWSQQWASGTVQAAQSAFNGLTFGPARGGHWSVTLPSTYSSRMNTIKKKQLTLGGARLAQLLHDIFQ